MGEVGKTVPRVLACITANGRKCTEKRGTDQWFTFQTYEGEGVSGKLGELIR